MPIGIGAALLISGAATAGSQIYGATKASGAVKQGQQLQDKAAADALAYEKEKDAYDRAQSAKTLQYGAANTQYGQQLSASRYADITGRLNPYIQTGQDASARMAQLLGLQPRYPGPMGTAPTIPTPPTF